MFQTTNQLCLFLPSDCVIFGVSTCRSLFDLFCTVTQEFQCFLRNGMGSRSPSSCILVLDSHEALHTKALWSSSPLSVNLYRLYLYGESFTCLQSAQNTHVASICQRCFGHGHRLKHWSFSKCFYRDIQAYGGFLK